MPGGCSQISREQEFAQAIFSIPHTANSGDWKPMQQGQRAFGFPASGANMFQNSEPYGQGRGESHSGARGGARGGGNRGRANRGRGGRGGRGTRFGGSGMCWPLPELPGPAASTQSCPPPRAAAQSKHSIPVAASAVDPSSENKAAAAALRANIGQKPKVPTTVPSRQSLPHGGKLTYPPTSRTLNPNAPNTVSHTPQTLNPNAPNTRNPNTPTPNTRKQPPVPSLSAHQAKMQPFQRPQPHFATPPKRPAGPRPTQRPFIRGPEPPVGPAQAPEYPINGHTSELVVQGDYDAHNPQGETFMERRMQWALHRLHTLEERMMQIETAGGAYNGV
ncbi:hypothetical protein WJX82_000855 [Trebouxia sp. C0006]